MAENNPLAQAFAEQFSKEGEFHIAENQEQAMTGNSNEFEFEAQPQQESEEEKNETLPTNESETETTEGEQEGETEEKSEEQPTEDSSLKTEETSSEETTSEPSISFEDEFAKRTEGKFESFEQMYEAATRQPEEQKPHEYANDLIAKLDELAKQGVNVDIDFVKAQMMDYSTYDVENVNQAKALIEMELKSQEPDITQKEIDFEFRKYKLDSDEYDEDEVDMAKIQLMRDAKKAKRSLEENQSKMALPKGGIDPEKQRQAEEAQRQATEKLHTMLKDSVKSYEKESVKLGDETFDYKVTDQAKKNLENLMLNTDKFFYQYVNKDGSIDTNRLRSDMFWLTNRESIVKSLLQQATAKGSKDVVSDMKNSSFESKPGAKPNNDFSLGGQIAKHFLNK